MQAIQETLEGWALRNRTTSAVVHPDNRAVLEGFLDHVSYRPIIGRGGGASYGDAALNANGLVADLSRLNRVLQFETQQGIISGESGIKVADLLAVTVPAGWFLPAVPGASHATLGGCISCDVHGKNHEKQGTLGHNILRLTLLLANGDIRECGPELDPILFWSTVGGMGCTGLILDVTLKLIPVESAFMVVDTVKTNNLEETFDAQKKSTSSDYSVTWLDATSTGKSLGRGIVINGRHAARSDIGLRTGKHEVTWPSKASFEFPWTPAVGFFRRRSLQAFNNLYYSWPRPGMRLRKAHPFFFPLHVISNINRFYGSNGFYEYQIAVPEDKAFELVLYMLLEIQKFRPGSFVTILKRFDARNRAPMSFPISGITFSIQILANDPEIRDVLDRFDAKTAEVGGRVYLAKDSRLRPDLVDAMYPERAHWASFINQIDPDCVFASDMSRRLRLREIH